MNLFGMPKKAQIEKFRETARSIGADESEDRFTATLKAVAKHRISRQPKRTANAATRRKKR
jgi:predicted type IV restriction endonuclease